jgi:hypothetical protein
MIHNVRHLTPRLYWWGFYCIKNYSGIIGPYTSEKECQERLGNLNVDYGLPIQYPSRYINTVAKYLRENGIVG